MLELYQRLQHANVTFAGDLAFVNTWNFFAPFPNKQFEQLTTTGPYAGTLSAFTAGVKLRTKYLHLLEQALSKGQTSFWASDSNRVIDTAKYFASGFFGLDWASRATLHIVPETLDQASNTLTPGRACRNYFNNVNSQGRSYGAAQLLAFGKTYLPAVSERLRKGNPDIVFSNEEVYSMQEMCGFETLVHGKSPWCDVFTRDEWDSFEYARDLQHYYRAGPGNPYGASLGFLWLNATTDLLQSGPSAAGPLFLSFNHDGDIITLLAALDLFPQDPHLPTTHVQHDRAWRLSDVTPMHGRIALERMTCAVENKCWSNPIYPNHVYCNEYSGHDTLETFVRIDVNDAILPMPGCVSGPGGSCPLEEFAERVSKRGKELTSFKEMCGNGEDGEEGIKFLHQ
jgi:acid phosphatase